MGRPRVAYYYDGEVGNYTYGPGHPMKPHRIRMTHALLVHSGVLRHVQTLRPPRATPEDMMQFHSEDYVRFLERITPSTAVEAGPRMLARFNIGEDCPVMDGLFEYCAISAGGSIAGAIQLNAGESDVAINWAGGLHHAKRGEPSGFCYVNDIVLAILELLKTHARVLYIDIDVHHGDGVEEAFYTTDRVMTLSFHKYGEFFPGTGALGDVGAGRGRGYSVNVPLRDGIDDAGYASVFEPVVAAVMEHYRPGAVVLQCGADSLAGDRLGGFNLSHAGHAACVQFVRAFGIPTMVLGGGGYTIRNVARAWAYETALCVGLESALPADVPFNEYYEYYAPDYSLAVPATTAPNLNTPEFLARVRERVLSMLRALPCAPSVQMHAVPRAMFADDTDGSDTDGGEDLGGPAIRDGGKPGVRCDLGLDGFGTIQGRRGRADDSDDSEEEDAPAEDEFAEFFALEALHRRRLLRADDPAYCPPAAQSA